VKIYLPRRFNSAFTEDDITSVNKGQMTLRQNSEHAVKIYLPRRFNSAFTEDDITSVNTGQLALIFTYRGVSDRKAYIVNLRMQ
jgi:hypothetical protein